MEEMEPYVASELPSLDCPEAEKLHKWRMWAAREIQRRAILGHYVLDGQIATAAGCPTAVRHAANSMMFPIDEIAFQMESVEEWIAFMNSNSTPQLTFRHVFATLFGKSDLNQSLTLHSKFSLLIALEGLQSFVSDFDSKTDSVVGLPSRNEVHGALANIYDITINRAPLSTVDRQEILLRWHAICLDAVADTRNLCRNLCAQYNIKQNIFGGSRIKNLTIDFDRWVTTNTARRALLHAIAIVDIAEQHPQGRSQPIHLPFSLFSAALIYAVFSITGSALIELPKTCDWKELVTAGDGIPTDWSTGFSDVHNFLFQTGAIRRETWTSRNLFYDINSVRKLLGFISAQWGVAHEMKFLLDEWIAQCH
jgi:hypothetical protein